MRKRLYLSGSDKVLGGVCGGLSEYMGVDPTIVRLIVAVLILLSGFTGSIIYFIAWFIMPKKPLF
ncbi:MAG: PspC domain-containing protein [Clostridiaceae bacterium]|nr:PspC domain-containing protein [Clostridiaceae bacterium]